MAEFWRVFRRGGWPGNALRRARFRGKKRVLQILNKALLKPLHGDNELLTFSLYHLLRRVCSISKDQRIEGGFQDEICGAG